VTGSVRRRRADSSSCSTSVHAYHCEAAHLGQTVEVTVAVQQREPSQMRCGDETAHCNVAATRRPFLSVSDQHHRRYLPRRSRRRIDPSNQSDLTARAPISSQSMEYQAPTRYTPNDLSLADDSDHSGRRCVSHIPEHAALIRPDAVPIYSPNQTDGTAVFEPSIGQALGEDR
jgi:hypothetical protein